jgi:hypothetical protein
VVVRVLTPRTSEFSGPGVLPAFTTLGIRYMRSRFGGGWLCPAEHTDDVLALLELRGYRIEATL